MWKAPKCLWSAPSHRGGGPWMEENSLTAISFDQCRLGQLVKKATTLATDLPIQDWDQMRCTHQSHVGTNESSTLSRSFSVLVCGAGWTMSCSWVLLQRRPLGPALLPCRELHTARVGAYRGSLLVPTVGCLPPPPCWKGVGSWHEGSCPGKLGLPCLHRAGQ